MKKGEFELVKIRRYIGCEELVVWPKCVNFLSKLKPHKNALKKKIAEHDINMAKGAWGQTCWYEGRGVSIYVAKGAPADTLVHECVHAAGIVLKMRGIEYGPAPQDEALAYLTGYIYKRIKKTTEVRK